MITLKHRTSGETSHHTLEEVQNIINRDRSDEFIPYTDDWRDGLELTDYELVGVDRCICNCGNEHDNEN